MIGVLLIHGFAGGRKEVVSLKTSLRKSGYKVEMPVLIGHEKGYLNMSKYGHKHWLLSAEEAYQNLQNQVEEIVIIGFSMGGLIGVNLERKFGAKALITINTPIYHWNFPQIIKNLKNEPQKYSKKYILTCVDKPINSLLEFKILLKKTIPLFGKVKCKTLVIQCLDDDTSLPKSKEYIKQKLGDNCQVREVAKGGHLVLCSPYRQEVISIVKDYLTNI